MLPLKEYVNDGSNLLLPSIIERTSYSWDVVWLNGNNLKHRIGAPVIYALEGNSDGYFNDDGTFVDNGDTIISTKYMLCGRHHRLDGPAILTRYRNYWHLYGRELVEKDFRLLKSRSLSSGFPIWIELFIMKELVTILEINQALFICPNLFQDYPIEWAISFLKINNAVEANFKHFYDIVEFERNI